MSKPQKKTKMQKTTNKKNNVLKQELGYLRRGEKHLAADFLGSITMILVTVFVIITLSFMSAMQKFDREISSKNAELRNSISSNFASLMENNLKDGDFSAFSQTLRTMISSNMIAYSIITDASQQEIYDSTLQNPEISNGTVSQKTLDYNKMKDTICIVKSTPDYNIFLGFKRHSGFIENTKQISHKFVYILLLCYILGIWFAYGICRRVLKPVKELIKVSGAFSSGDLSERLEQTKYVEFNELVDSYNGMADSMQRLYSSMEQKVNERTRQLNEAIKELQNTQAMMVHSEKMKSLGELVAGIMHEINNPINFIYGNMSHLKNYSSDLIALIDSFEEYKNDLTEEHKLAYEKMIKDIDYEFLKEDLPDLIKSCHEGTERTKNIILNLKDFSRMEESAITNVELAKEIDSTLNILHNKFKNKITVHKDYHEDVPKIEAYGGQLNQVFMNILDNAAFAVADMEHGDVWITIKKDDKFAYIEIEDNGKGMSEETKNKIFNPFFTTKPVGQGTGLGLSISYKVIKNHHGIIDVQSEVGKGTKFTIKLPLVFEHQKQEDENKKDDTIEVI